MMNGPKCRDWLPGMLEAIPSFVFLLIWRASEVLETAGWAGVFLAGAVLLAFPMFKVAFNPIFLGINIHLVVITPLIVGLHRGGFTRVAHLVEQQSYFSVLLTIFATGCFLTLCSRKGFLGTKGLPTSAVRQGSIVMLAASAAAIVWATTVEGYGFFAVGLPIIALFAVRRALLNQTRNLRSTNDG